MIKLINIELIKVFKHISIYVMLIIIFLFCFFNNYIYKVDYDKEGIYKYEVYEDLDKQINELENELLKYDINKNSDKNMYVTIKSNLDVVKQKSRYDKNSWQYLKYNDYLYEYIYNINYYKYIDNDVNMLNKSIGVYDAVLNRFNNSDWKYFVNLEKISLEREINNYKKNIDCLVDVYEKEKLNVKLEELYNDLETLNYRLKYEISYSNTYLNKALIEYRESLSNSIKISNYQDKLNYNENIKKMNLNKYIVENKINLNKQNNLNYQLRTVVDDYELFIVILILIVSSILVADEFNKGTIKLLLIKPYSRNKILLSKYLTGIIIIIFSVIFIILSQLLIGGSLFGFDSLNMRVAVYDFNSMNIETFNIFVYMLIRIVVKLPLLIFILTLCYAIMIISCNTMLSFSIVILLYTFSEIINSLIVNYNWKFFSYFITLNWNFKDYLFGGLAVSPYINLKKSILIYLIYVIILLLIVFRSFLKKNIKNV